MPCSAPDNEMPTTPVIALSAIDVDKACQQDTSVVARGLGDAIEGGAGLAVFGGDDLALGIVEMAVGGLHGQFPHALQDGAGCVQRPFRHA